jgi:NADPH:quinone reductase-like Zn-dependent oxidoreductase
VLVRVHAASANAGDWHLLRGTPLPFRLVAGLIKPKYKIIGNDIAGTVEAVGRNVTKFKPGDEVFGEVSRCGFGAYAEYVVARQTAMAPKPANLSFEEAASVPTAGCTALQGLRKGNILSAQKVLIHGGAGGVGHIAIQIARAFGADVFATGSASQRATVEGFGATFIDRDTAVAIYVAEHTGGRGFDVVYDTVGGKVLDASFEAVRRFGHVVSALGWGTHALAPLSFRAATYSGVFTLLPLLSGEGRTHHGEIMTEATRLIEAGKLVPTLDARHFTLENVGDAYALIRDHATQGKLVVEI